MRKILQSQKTFANHLDDYQAMLALAESNPAAAAALSAAQTKPSTPTTAASKSASPAPAASSAASGSKRSAAAAKRAAAKEKQEQEKQEKKKARHTPKPGPEEQPQPEAGPQQDPPQQDADVEMVDAGAAPPETTQTQNQSEPPHNTPQSYPRESLILPAYAKPPPPSHPGDTDPLLVSYIPPFPTDDELRALMTAPPLSYLEARATWGEEEARYPVRVFCAVCGYWGRVKCMKCGTRVCALDCLEAHREECVTRYGL